MSAARFTAGNGVSITMERDVIDVTKVCREVIEPKLDAPGTRKSIAGMTTVTVEVSDGQRESTFVISGDDLFDELRTAPGPSEAFAILDASDNATEVYSSYRS